MSLLSDTSVYSTFLSSDAMQCSLCHSEHHHRPRIGRPIRRTYNKGWSDRPVARWGKSSKHTACRAMRSVPNGNSSFCVCPHVRVCAWESHNGARSLSGATFIMDETLSDDGARRLLRRSLLHGRGRLLWHAGTIDYNV